MAFASPHALRSIRRSLRNAASQTLRARGPRPFVDSLENRRLLSVANGSFENGLDEWTASPEWLAMATPYFYGDGYEYFPTDGGMFATLQPNGYEQESRLSQTFTAGRGDTLSGHALLVSREYWGNLDEAYVKVKDDAGQTVATLYYNSTRTVFPWGASQWTYWEHVFDEAGTYTLEASIVNRQHSDGPSVLGLDAIELHDVSSVPPNAPPSVSAGGNYALLEGNDLTMTATGSDPDGDVLSYAWDLNNDGVYGDLYGNHNTVAWAELVRMGVNDGPGTYPISVRANDRHGNTPTASANIVVTNVPPQLVSMTGPSVVTDRTPVVFTAEAWDPAGAADPLRYDWSVTRNGSQFATGTGRRFEFVTNGGVDYWLTLNVSDGDGGVYTNSQQVSLEGNYEPGISWVKTYGPSEEGYPVYIDGEFFDGNFADNAHEVWVDWGDGTTNVYLPGASYQGEVLSGIVDPATGHAYYLVDRKTFGDAEAFAQSLGGHLASISSQAEHDMLWEAFAQFDPWFPPQNDMWIGLTDSEGYGGSEGNFVWTSGEPVNYTNWGRGEPNNAGGNEDFVSFYGSQAGRWNDWGANVLRSVIELPRPTNFIDAPQSRYFSAMHAYKDEAPGGGAYPITVTVVDQTGARSAPAHADAEVYNVLPFIWLDGMSFAQEGTESSIYFSPSDPGDDEWQVTIDYGDGSAPVVYDTDHLASQYLRHVYAQQGTYTLVTTVLEKDTGTLVTASSQVEVANVAPTLGGLSISATEAAAGDEITVGGTVTDPGTSDVVTLTVDWGDGTSTELVRSGGGTHPFSATHAYAADGYYPITITAADPDGGSDSADSTGEMPAGAFQWDVNGHWYAAMNVPNSYEGIAGARAAAADLGAYVVSINDEPEQQMLIDRILYNPDDFYARYEGYWIGLSDFNSEGTFVWDDGEPLTYSNWHPGTNEPNEYWGDGTEDYVVMNWHFANWYSDALPGSWNDMTAFAFGGNAVYRAIYEWNEGPERLAVQVGAPVPALAIGPDAVVDEGSAFNRAGAIGNAGAGAWAATVDYGDGAGPQPLPLAGGNTFNLFHVYYDEGTYQVTVSATRADGHTVSDALTVTASNVAPAATITGVPTWNVDEGTVISLGGVVSDPGADALTYAWSVTRDGQPYEPAFVLSLPDRFDFFANDNGQYVATLTVSDGDGGVTAVSTTAINVANVAPSITGLSGPAFMVRGQTAEFTSGAFDPGWDVLQQSIDVYDSAGEHVAHALNGSLWFTPTMEGQYAVHVTTTDDDGGQAHEYILVQVVAAHLWVNPENESDTVLLVGGTIGNDLIYVRPGATAGTVEVGFGRDVVGQFTPTRGVIVHGQAGDDGVYVSPNVRLPATVYGGGGNDAVYAGNSGSLIVGGDGNDYLFGGDGRDILIGGNGADRIQGNGGEDILISGRTAYDGMAIELNDIALEWRRTDRTYAQRVDAISGRTGSGYNAGSVFRTAGSDAGSATLFDDSPGDVLTGNAGQDWFLFHAGNDRAADAGRTERSSLIVP